MSKLKALTFAALASAGIAFAQGDTLEMGGTGDRARFEQPGKPSRGMSQERVRAEFGSPQSTQPAVGDPPISRWHYPNFVVFFEYDKVIHAVSKR